IAQRRRVIHRVAHHRRIRATHEHERHLVGDRRERVLDHLERYEIHHSPASITILPCVSSSALAPGGTMQVASNSSTMSGPCIRFASAARPNTGVSTNFPPK